MFRNLNARAYVVGGGIRDEILGLKPSDVDYVVEATEEEFLSVFPELTYSKVGNIFPIFLMDGKEVALTRTEKCVGNNYQDFEVTDVGVSIHDDLFRRDFTCNSIAKNYVTGEYVDPTGGVEDIKLHVLRCTNPVAFIEDPLRIYRGARFASVLDFRASADTKALMMTHKDRLKFVKPERVVFELEKLFKKAKKPSMFFRFLADIDALKYHFAPLDQLRFVPGGPVKYHGNNTAFDHTMEVIDRCKAAGLDFDCFIACLCHDFGKGTTDPSVLPHHYAHGVRSYKICQEYFLNHRFEARTQKLALVVAHNHMNLRQIVHMRTRKAIEFFKRIPRDLRLEFLSCCDCDHTLSEDVAAEFFKLEKAVTTAKIEIPKDCKDPAEYAIKCMVSRYKEL